MKTNILYIFLATVFSAVFSYVYVFSYIAIAYRGRAVLDFFNLDYCLGTGKQIYPYLLFLMSPVVVFTCFFVFVMYLFYRYIKSEEEYKEDRKFILFLGIYIFVSIILFYQYLSHTVGVPLGIEICTPGVPQSAETY